MSTTAAPARRQSSSFAGEMASCAELLGRLMPSASIALAMVLAVYMPPHEPGPGIARCSRSASAASLSFAGRVLADGFEDGDDVELAAVAFE